MQELIIGLPPGIAEDELMQACREANCTCIKIADIRPFKIDDKIKTGDPMNFYCLGFTLGEFSKSKKLNP